MSVKPRLERPHEPIAERPREPIAERPRSFVAERPTELEPERTRERARELERARTPEPELPHAKPHDRAGEPGYVPRRERSRAPESPFDLDSPNLPASPWSDLAAEPEFEPEVEVEPGAEEGVAEPGKLEGPRRRRRRRGRRRERDRERPERAAAPAPSDEDLEPAFEEEEGEEAEPVLDHEAPSRGDAEVEGVTLLDEFDFGEEPLVEEYEEAGQDELREEPAHAAVEEEIDPELEEEIRREIDEIAELEREMGLRGPIEARPRRGDEREAEAGRGGSRAPRGRGMAKPPIQEIFRRGDEVLVQVIKESIGTKGPTLSTYISIPGRYLVLMPGLNRVGVSRKIADEAPAPQAPRDHERAEPAQGARLHRPDRRARPHQERAGPRPGLPAAALEGHPPPDQEGQGPGADLPGIGHDHADHPRHLHVRDRHDLDRRARGLRAGPGVPPQS